MTEELTKTDYDYILLQYRLERGDELTEDERINATMAKMKFGLEFIEGFQLDDGPDYRTMYIENYSMRGIGCRPNGNIIGIVKVRNIHPYLNYCRVNCSYIKTRFTLKINDYIGIVDNNMWLMYPTNDFDIERYNFDSKDSLCVIEGSKGYGAINFDGEVVIEPIYASVFPKKFGALLITHPQKQQIKNTSNPCGTALVDNKGNIVVPFGRYSVMELPRWQPYNLSEKYLIVADNCYWGIIDHMGRTIIPTSYEDIRFCYSGKTLVAVNDTETHLYNLKGKILLSNAKYDYLNHITDNIIIAMVNGKIGIIDIKENVKVDFIYEEICPMFHKFGECKFEVTKRIKKVKNEDRRPIYPEVARGIIDENGDIIIPIEYIDIQAHGEIICASRSKKGYDYYYKDGSRVPLK
jgi:hypothetical protein